MFCPRCPRKEVARVDIRIDTGALFHLRNGHGDGRQRSAQLRDRGLALNERRPRGGR